MIADGWKRVLEMEEEMQAEPSGKFSIQPINPFSRVFRRIKECLRIAQYHLPRDGLATGSPPGMQILRLL